MMSQSENGTRQRAKMKEEDDVRGEDKVTRKNVARIVGQGGKEMTVEDEERGTTEGDGRSIGLTCSYGRTHRHTSSSRVSPGAREGGRVVDEGAAEREDHQSTRGEWRVLCNHGAEPRAGKPNQKR